MISGHEYGGASCGRIRRSLAGKESYSVRERLKGEDPLKGHSRSRLRRADAADD